MSRAGSCVRFISGQSGERMKPTFMSALFTIPPRLMVFGSEPEVTAVVQDTAGYWNNLDEVRRAAYRGTSPLDVPLLPVALSNCVMAPPEQLHRPNRSHDLATASVRSPSIPSRPVLPRVGSMLALSVRPTSGLTIIGPGAWRPQREGGEAHPLENDNEHSAAFRCQADPACAPSQFSR